MKSHKFLLGLILFLLGLTGVFTLLAMPLTLDTLPEEVREEVLRQFTEEQLRWLSLINPAVLLLIAVVVGTLLYDKVKLAVPSLENALSGKPWADVLVNQLKSGIPAGILSGVLILAVYHAFKPLLPPTLIEMGGTQIIPVAVRFLYGGITEEILIRFGLMTLLVWIGFKISGRLTPLIYWSGILLSSIIFGIGHLPFAYQLIPEPDTYLILYVIIGNSVGGIIFGWLYWKKGLESAMFAHIMAHVTMLAGTLAGL